MIGPGMNKLNRTVTELGIIDLKAQKKDGIWIAAITSMHEGKPCTAVSTSKTISGAISRSVSRLNELKRGGVHSLPS